jgi:hypothetical protein
MSAVVLTLGACGSDDGSTKDSPTKPTVKIDCQAEDVHGNSYDRCKLMEGDQAFVKATIGRQFEIDGFGLPKIGQEVWLVCHTGDLGNSSFGIVVNQGKTRPDGEWTLGHIDGEPFAYVGRIIEVAIDDYENKARELNDKLEAKFGESIRSNSCEDNRVIIGNTEKTLLQQR